MDYFLNNKGTYYWQVYRVDCSETEDNDHCEIESSPRKFRLR